MSQILKLRTLNDGSSHYSMRINFDGTDYEVQMHWSTREARWYLSLLTSAGVMISSHMKIMSNWPLLRFYHDRPGMPTGELMAVTTTPDRSPPGLHDLAVDARCTLMYFPEGSL
jgi:hypothetical protein